MEPVLQHFQEFYRYYILALLVLAPPTIIFRRYTFPAIQYTVEFVIYVGLMHVGVGTIVRVAGWFKDQSTMKRARGLANASYDPGWTTPYLEFWRRELYTPQGLIYLEIVLAIIILALMVRIRGIGAQKRKKKRAPTAAKRRSAAPNGYRYKSRGGDKR
ncbi:MAG: hypothetical protein GWP08_06895 [Nitrospiraceae bacterium]|nr:hypothetical protein [Nitrospiraceae bacterium]